MCDFIKLKGPVVELMAKERLAPRSPTKSLERWTLLTEVLRLAFYNALSLHTVDHVHKRMCTRIYMCVCVGRHPILRNPVKGAFARGRCAHLSQIARQFAQDAGISDRTSEEGCAEVCATSSRI